MERDGREPVPFRTSRVGFGTASLHHIPFRRGRSAMLHAALDCGIRHFDTAPLYGEGRAELDIGRTLYRDRHTFSIATKVGYLPNTLLRRTPGALFAHRAVVRMWRSIRSRHSMKRRRSFQLEIVEKSFSQSLRHLRTEYVDLLLLHDPTPADLPDVERLAPWLERQKSLGKARYLGAAGNAQECVAIDKALPGLFDVLQVEDSLDGREADAVLESGRPLQVTFGYLRRARRTRQSINGARVLRQALERNSTGTVLVSTRSPDRLRRMLQCEALEAGPCFGV